MASAPQYLPPLDQCLRREAPVQSWRQIYDKVESHHTSIEVLDDPKAQDVLNSIFSPFTKAPADKQTFNTLTSAVNVTPEQNGGYKVEEIKEDALWLATKADISETAALRIALLEWQDRHLTCLRDAANNWKNNLDAAKSLVKESQKKRRQALARLYQEESSYARRCSSTLLRKRLLPQTRTERGKERPTSETPSKYGDVIFKTICPTNDHEIGITAGLTALDVAVQQLEKAGTWSDVDDDDNSLEIARLEHSVAGLAQTIQTMYVFAASSTRVCSSNAIDKIFDALARYGFFVNMQPVSESHASMISTLQSLTAMFTLSALRIDILTNCIDLDKVAYSSQGERPAAKAYINDPACVARMTDLLLDASHSPGPATPAAFLWVFVLDLVKEASQAGSLPQTSRSQDPQENVYAQAWRNIMSSDLSEDPRLVLASRSVDELRVFDILLGIGTNLANIFHSPLNQDIEQSLRNTSLDLIAASRGLVQYGPEIITFLLFVIGGDKSHWSALDAHRRQTYDLVAERFLKDPELGPAFLMEAKTRFPVEISPFLQMMRVVLLRCSNEDDVLDMKMALLSRADVFTQQLPLRFDHFEQLEASEDIPENRIRLTYDLPIFTSKRSHQLLAAAPSGAMTAASSALSLRQKQVTLDEHFIPTDTVGVIVDDRASPKVITWHHEFSPLRYMISCLSTCLPMSELVEYVSRTEHALQSAADIITFFACLVEILPSTQSSNAASALNLTELLDDMPSQITAGKDLTSIVFEICETQLSALKQQSADEGATETVIACLQFFNAVVAKAPSRLWPLLARSQLLGFSGEDGSLNSIASHPNMTAERYEIVVACTKLFAGLVDASLDVTTAKAPKRQVLSRLALMTANDAAVAVSPQKIKSTVLISLARPLLGVYANGPDYRFESPTNYSLIGDLGEIFNKILLFTHSTGNEPRLQDRIAGVLADTAEIITKYLLSASGAANSITHMLALSLAANRALTDFSSVDGLRLRTQNHKLLTLASTALRVGNLQSLPTPPLAIDLFKAAPLLAACFVNDTISQDTTAALLDVLISTPSQNAQQSPSLLSHMGPGVAKSFLSAISLALRSQSGSQTGLALWNLLSAVVSSRQQWFAIFLLTGAAPRERKPGTAASTTAENTQLHGSSVLTYALQQVSSLAAGNFERTSAILKFIMLCQDNWPWAMSHMRKEENAGFIDGISNYIMQLKRDTQTPDSTLYRDATLAGQAAEILAMYLHAARQLGDKSAIAKIVPKLAYLRNYGIASPRYNISLQNRLPSNIATVFPTLKLSSLKHTLLNTPSYGENYFYDLNLASQLLLRSSRPTNILNDLKLANLNLSAVDAQITLTKRWSALAVELAKSLDMLDTNERDGVYELLADVTRQCLEQQSQSSNNGSLPEALTQALSSIRLDLAQTLLQELTRGRGAEKYTHNTFSLAWEATRAVQPDFSDPYGKGNATQYRTILRILFLSLQSIKRRVPPQAKSQQRSQDLRMSVMGVSKTASKDKQLQAFAEANDLLEVLDEVVSKGFKALATLVHDDQMACKPSDFVLLTAILQTVLAIPNIDLLHSQIAVQFGNAGTSRYATSLFSWSHQLSATSGNAGDPIYGELAALFILELSSVPAMAEQLAVDGILSQLSAANLMHFYNRPNGMSPFDNPTRVHSIWSRGILPLCLNLMDSVGAPIAAEVSAFLNQYPTQIARVSTALANRSAQIGTRPGQSNMTLSLASETHSLALISLLIDRYRVAGVSTGALAADIAPLDWDRATVKEELEDWLGNLGSLLERVVPGNEMDAELARRKPLLAGGPASSRLDERVVEELRSALECLKVDVTV